MPSSAGLFRLAIALLVAATLSWPLPARAAEPLQADRIVVLKVQRELRLLHDGAVIKSYPIGLGPHPKGAKRRKGDGRTPESVYVIDWRTSRTPFHRALHISYPRPQDLARARAAHQEPGGAIYIHGMPRWYGHLDPVRFFVDWTDGCIAVGNIAIEEIWNAVPDGTAIEIRP